MYIPRSLAFPTLLLALLFTSCSEEVKDAEVTSPNSTEITSAPPAVDPAQGQPQSAVVSDPNPAHGEPGHRCEIPVGASLSSAPAPGSTAAGATTPMINTAPVQPTMSATPTSTAPGMNPPHGQPGHDCNVAVGSPLPK